MVYSYSEAQEQLSSLLEKALSEGEIKLRNQDGRIFVIRPEQPLKSSPFEVQSLKLPIDKADIFEAIGESRARF
ncbi:hypothetical protein PN466_21115 [Roseofilum reptotaenium CS-1145]|nr:hypothetical protein [Roseofilum reptotaenium]MDB9519448.1 hypothetical protein [Roseofilum reptotaenium CS-1145]